MSRDLDASTATKTFTYGGTAEYAAPERWRGLPATYKTDLYAVGCIGYELVAGHRPFPGPDDARLQHQHLQVEPPPVPASPVLARWIMRLLDKDPDARHQDAQAALAALTAGATVSGPLAAAGLQRAQRRQEQAAAQASTKTAIAAIMSQRRQALADLGDTCAAAADSARRNGGALGRAKIGYLNHIDHFDGRVIRTIILDPDRAPLVKLAFELYATGDYSLDDLADELYDRGLRTRPTGRHPTKKISIHKLSDMLRDRYYLGYVDYKGEEIRGRHEPLIEDEELFDQVQEIIESRATAKERRRVHHHYLKGSVFCVTRSKKPSNTTTPTSSSGQSSSPMSARTSTP